MKRIILTLAFGLAPWFTYAQRPGPGLLEPANHTLMLIDQQGQLAFAVHSIPVTELRINVAIVTGASRIFQVPTIITLITTIHFAGPLIPEVTDVYPLPGLRGAGRTGAGFPEPFEHERLGRRCCA